MKKKTLCLLMLLALAFCQVGAQPAIDNFKMLESQGAQPKDFKKIANSSKNMSDYNVFLRDLVMKGRVLYGTLLNDYLNTIVDNLLQNDLTLRSKVHVYILKSPAVNACATTNGLVIVNLGLIAQVSNESELAYILAHEIAHFAENHVTRINDYNKDTLKGHDILDNYVKYHSRSREQELAADRIALERYFQQTSYSYAAVDGVFDVLQYADLPFDEIPFPRSLVEEEFYSFPDKYYLEQVSPIYNRSDMVDTLFTHPNIEKRRTAALKIIDGLSNNGRKLFVQSEELFNEIRELARFECLNCYLSEHQFDQAFYNAYVLQQSHPDNAFLEEVIVSSLYGYSKHKNHGNTADVILTPQSVTGEMQQTSYFFSKLTKPESSLLALRAAWKAKQKHPENRYYSDVIKDAMKDVFVTNKMKYQAFSDYPMGTNPDSIVVEPIPETRDTLKGKYAHIKQQKQVAKVIPNEKFKTPNFMLVDIHQDSTFAAMAQATINEAEDERILNVVKRKHQPVTFNSMVVAKPQYVISPRSNQSIKRAEKLSDRLSKNITRCVSRLKKTSITYSVNDVCNFTTEQYNGYAKLQQWLYEFFQGDGLKMYYHISKDMSSTFELTGTTKLCLIGVKRVSAPFVTTDKIDNLLLSVICPYVLPIALTTFALPRYSTTMYILVADYETGETELFKGERVRSTMSEAYVNAFTYDELYKFLKGK